MEGVDFTMAFPDVLGNFQHYSRSYYVVFASITVFADFLVLFLLAAKKIPLDGLKLNHVMLLNLALCDIVYEIVTTVAMFWPSNFCESAENCNKLSFIYLALNLSTVFNIVVESLKKGLYDFGPHSHASFGSRVYRSISSWLAAFIIAYIDFKNGGFMDGTAMAFLGRFKAFGYMLFAVIFISGVLVLLLTIGFAVPREKFKLPEILTTRRELIFVVSSTPQDDVVFSCSFMAIFVGWCAWVVIGVDTRIMKTAEVMKSFEVTRLAARIINPLTIWHSFSHGKMKFPPCELQLRNTNKL